MLRLALLVVGGILIAVAIAAAIAGCPLLPLTIQFGLGGIVLIVAIIFERGRYKPATPQTPDADWVATGESFTDPTSGEAVTVYYQPASGERRYVRR
jgi:hypothetical protein